MRALALICCACTVTLVSKEGPPCTATRPFTHDKTTVTIVAACGPVDLAEWEAHCACALRTHTLTCCACSGTIVSEEGPLCTATRPISDDETTVTIIAACGTMHLAAFARVSCAVRALTLTHCACSVTSTGKE